MVLNIERLLIEMLAFAHWQQDRETLGAPVDHSWMAVYLISVLSCQASKLDPVDVMRRAVKALAELQAAGVLLDDQPPIPPVILDAAERIQ
jgi:hypothetical protein